MYSHQTLLIKQTTDAKIREKAKYLGTSKHLYYEFRNGLVYRIYSDQLLFYVPIDMCDKVITAYHNDIGYIGVNRTVELIKRIYWFPQLTDRVRKYIGNCLKCIIFSPSEGRKEGFLKLFKKENKPFSTIHIDHYDPLNNTVCPFRHIFGTVDAFSKFIILYPVCTVKTKEVCFKLKEYFS